ncbi:hypothetical protein WJX84_000600 [Apatococcus fuscideae]|uniref:Protein pelota homolog n=1 Tax=Apatococcus fuscideae TaxID=2026836 RepID=A0AAW1T9M2_9CHLO
MKLLSRSYTKNGEGSVKLIAEEGEDLWHAYNIIRQGDLVTATTFRKISRDSGAGTQSEKVKIKLTIQIKSVEYDAEGQELRLRGKNLTESEHVRPGAYHTLQVETQRAFTLEKALWDAVDMDRIQVACNPAARADLAAVLITEGLANMVLVGSAVTLTCASIETSMPGKRGAAAEGYSKALQSFFSKIFQAVVRHVDWGIVKCLVIAGPGFAKEQFREYLLAEAVRQDLKPIMTNKDKILLAQASSAYSHSLKEVFANPGIAAQIKDTKAAQETKALQDFYSRLSTDSARAFYGSGHVIAAHELQAIQTLLISDKLFRTSDVAKRKRYVELVEEVEKANGTALVYSSLHVSGQQLDQLSGIAAILRFPLPDLEDQELDAAI